MKLSLVMKKKLLEEINYVLQKMKSTTNNAEKLYFYSAISGAAQRIMNLEYDPELAFVHHVTRYTFDLLNGAIAAAQTQKVSTIPDSLFAALEEEIGQLSKRIKSNETTHPILENIANLAYAATGNGYYLYLKGDLKL